MFKKDRADNKPLDDKQSDKNHLNKIHLDQQDLSKKAVSIKEVTAQKKVNQIHDTNQISEVKLTAPQALTDVKLAKKGLYAEALLILLSVGVFAVFMPQHAVAVALGSAISLIAGAFFLWRYYAPVQMGQKRTAQMVQSMNRAAAGKFVLILVGFIAAYQWLGKAEAPWVLGGYIWALLAQMIARAFVVINDKSDS